MQLRQSLSSALDPPPAELKKILSHGNQHMEKLIINYEQEESFPKNHKASPYAPKSKPLLKLKGDQRGGLVPERINSKERNYGKLYFNNMMIGNLCRQPESGFERA